MHHRRKVSNFWRGKPLCFGCTKLREVKLWPPVSHPSLCHVSLGISGPAPLVQLWHVSHGGFTLVISVNNSVLTNLWISGCLFCSVPQHSVDQGQRDGHHGEYDQQSHNGQSPARVLQVFLRGLNGRESVMSQEQMDENCFGSEIELNRMASLSLCKQWYLLCSSFKTLLDIQP